MLSNMNSQICDNGQCSKYLSVLFEVKSWVLDEFLPFLCLTPIVTLVFLTVTQYFIIIPYTCLKWKPAIIFWLAYFLWAKYDSETVNGKGRKIQSFKYFFLLNSLRRYFPLRLIKLADLPPDRNYILACFPHALYPFGCGTNFCTNTNKVAELFPDIDIRIATISLLFRFPVARELYMALGFCTSNPENILYLLNSKPAKAVAIFPGGTREGLFSTPGNIYTIIKNRKGFIRIALESGSPLVPVFSFGEHNTFDNIRLKAPIFRHLIAFFYKYLGIHLTFANGRGYFQKHFGLFPRRTPITTVVGKPIEVPKVRNPSAEMVDEYQEKFYKALQDLFETYKHEYGEGDAAQLVMV